MSKIYLGDYVVDEYGHKGHVISCRGGYVGRWQVKGADGNLRYKSSRDLTVIIPYTKRPTRPSGSRLTINEKLDLLFEYLDIEIEDIPRIVKRRSNGEVSGNQEPEEVTQKDAQ